MDPAARSGAGCCGGRRTMAPEVGVPPHAGSDIATAFQIRHSALMPKRPPNPVLTFDRSRAKDSRVLLRSPRAGVGPQSSVALGLLALIKSADAR